MHNERTTRRSFESRVKNKKKDNAKRGKEGGCLFCTSTSNDFTRQEHIIPESAGNDSKAVNNPFILDPGIVCNICNSERLSVLDQAFVQFPPILFSRMYSGIPNKKRKIPNYKHDEFIWKYMKGRHRFMNLRGQYVWVYCGNGKPVKLKEKGNIVVSPLFPVFKRTDVSDINIEKILRFLGKIWLEHLASQYSNTFALVDEEDQKIRRLFLEKSKSGFEDEYNDLRKFVIGEQQGWGYIGVPKEFEISNDRSLHVEASRNDQGHYLLETKILGCTLNAYIGFDNNKANLQQFNDKVTWKING